MLKPDHGSLVREEEEERERQPAGGGKTKGKVKESKREGEERGRGQTEEGWERKGRRRGRRGSLLGRPSIPLVFGRASGVPRPEWQPGQTSPLPATLGG